MSQEKYDQRTEKSDDNAYAKGVAIGAFFRSSALALATMITSRTEISALTRNYLLPTWDIFPE